MTIIKNKSKPTEEKNQESDNHENNDSNVRTVDIQVEGPSQERVREDIQLHLRDERLSPSQHSHVREEKRSGLEDIAETGPSHSKRRHKASPLRSRRSMLSGSCSPSASTSNASVPQNSGYNSEDEYDHTHKPSSGQDWAKKDAIFEKRMRNRGLIVKNMSGDGACLFRSVADQIYGDENMHALVRKSCMDYMATNSDYFSQYVTEDFSKYVTRKRESYTHGNHVELQAMSEIYNRKIEVYCYGIEPINIFYGVEQNDYEPIRLSYQRDCHYNSIVNPNKSSIGCGLGLPNFSHGAADSKLIKDALREREDYQIEQALIENKLQASDWEATSEAISQQIARESYLQWIHDNEKRDKEKYGSASTTYDEPATQRAVKPSTQLSPRLTDKEDDNQFSLQHKEKLESDIYGLSNWEDNILAEVLAASEKDYLDNLRKTLGSCSKNDNDVQPSTSR